MHADNGEAKWLTLPELIQQADLGEPEVRHIVDQFDRFLAYRQFSDSTRYSPNTAEAVVHIASLYRRGWRTEEIMEVLTSVNQEEDGTLPGQDPPETVDLMAPKDQGSYLLLPSLKLVQTLMSNITTLTTKIAAAMAEIINLREENRTLRTLLTRYRNLEN